MENKEKDNSNNRNARAQAYGKGFDCVASNLSGTDTMLTAKCKWKEVRYRIVDSFQSLCRQWVWLKALNSHCNKIHRWALELFKTAHTNTT